MASGGVGTVRVGEDPTHPELTVAELSAVVQAAESARKYVTAHADGVEGIANALDAGVHVSLATVYNTLHQFTDAGLLRILSIDGARTYFDTNTSDHHHFYVEGENTVFDIDAGPVTVTNLPEPPEGMEIANVDIVIRLRPKR